jgi:hypothetical protein
MAIQEKYPKHNVLTRNGTVVRMNDAALKMAQKHFGVNKQRMVTHEVPPEILKLQKIDIIKADIKVQPSVKEPVAENVVEHDIVLESIKKTRKAPVKSKSAK